VIRSRFPIFSALLALAAGLGGQAGAGGTPAGTVIQNQASATADPINPGGPGLSAQSNVVQAVVSPVCSLSVTPDGSTDAPGQSVTLLPTDTATFTYVVTNTGNTTNTYTLAALVDPASAFTPGPVNLYLDANGNGQLDAAERATTVSSLTLAPDQAANVFLLAATSDASRGDAYVNVQAACPAARPPTRTTSRACASDRPRC